MFISKKKLIMYLEDIKKSNHDYYNSLMEKTDSDDETVLLKNAYNSGCIDGTNQTCNMLASMLNL